MYQILALSFMMGKENSHEFTSEELAMLNIVASTIFDGDITFNSYSLNVSDHIISDQPMPMSYEDPGIVNVNAVTSEYGAVNMTIHLYARSNDIADSQIVKMEIGGEDYSYLSYDMIKSMFKVFGQFFYVDSLVFGIVTYPDFQVTEESTFTLDLNNQGNEQLRFNGSVDISGITKNASGQTSADFEFSGLELNDSYGDVDYTISGNAFLNLMYIEPTQSVDFEIPEEFWGTYVDVLTMGQEYQYEITADDVFSYGVSYKESMGVTNFTYNEDTTDNGSPCKMISLETETEELGVVAYSFALHQDEKIFMILSVEGIDVMRVELIPVTTP